MGTWSEGVLGNDTALDLLSEFEDLLDVTDLYPLSEITPDTAASVKDQLSAPASSILWGRLEEQMENYDWNIGCQVVAVLAMAVGADICKTLKQTCIRTAKDDEMAKDSQPRKAEMKRLIAALKTYNFETPVIWESQGLLQVMAEAAK